MKKIKSIYIIFMIFLLMVIVSFAILYRYSTKNLQDSLMQTATIQMEYSSSLLEQKIKEIEIEADGILNSEDLKNLHLCITEDDDVYNYVVAVNAIKDYIDGRQRSNVGMAEFTLYWPRSKRIVSNLQTAAFEAEMLEQAEDNLWLIYHGEMYFIRKYVTDWDYLDEEPYLLIKMERDYLYKIKNMALDMGKGGSLLVDADGKSFFSTNELEKALLAEMEKEHNPVSSYEVKIRQGKYQIVESKTAKNGFKLISYYPIQEMNKSVVNITKITGVSLVIVLAVGFMFMALYYKNILLQLKILTEKLKEVENGNLSTQIMVLPNNEFSYVFVQFNRMVIRIRQLLDTTIKEQELRNQAELRQLQLQIHPHFLYNSLSYIVTVADKPEAVTEMAVHLANYYRYCTKNKSVATIGEEIAYAKSYLAIMAMRKQIEYDVDVAKELYEVKIIPLIIQPMIENAIEHGIEGRENAKHIFFKMYRLENGTIRAEISDDGDGMSKEDIEHLMERLQRKKRDENESVGLWNVNQRLINYYDESAGLQFDKSMWGGLLVAFTFLPKEKKDDSVDR